jgi:putative flippase GtrA
MPARVKFSSRTAVRFVLVGALNTLTGLLVIYALKYVFGMPDIGANLFGYAIGLTVSYTLNRRWTFSYRGGHQGAIARFALLTIVAYAANLACVCAAIYLFSVNSYIAQTIGIVPYTLISYFGSRLFVFAPMPSEQLSAVPRPEEGR